MYNSDLRQQYLDDLNNFNFTLHRQGNLVTFSKTANDDYYTFSSKAKKQVPLRGNVSSKFSKKSAFRLKKFLLKTKIDEMYKDCFSLTLTFPKMIFNLAIAQEILKRFCEYLKNKYGFGIVWKKEFTKAGRIHFHLILFNNHPIYLGNYFYCNSVKSTLPKFLFLNDIYKKQSVHVFPQEKKFYIFNKKLNFTLTNFEPIQRNSDNSILSYCKGLRFVIQREYLKFLNRFLIEKNNQDFNILHAFHSAIDIDRVKSKGIVCYLADYLTSDETTFKKDKSYQNSCPKFCRNNGRWWGYINMDCYLHDEKIYSMNSQKYLELQKFFNKQFLDTDDIKLRHITVDDEKYCIGLTTFNTIFLNDNFDISDYFQNFDIKCPANLGTFENKLNHDFLTSFKKVKECENKYSRIYDIKEPVRLSRSQLEYYYNKSYLVRNRQVITHLNEFDLFVGELMKKYTDVEFLNKFTKSDYNNINF